VSGLPPEYVEFAPKSVD